jgi:hypothetical protein
MSAYLHQLAEATAHSDTDYFSFNHDKQRDAVANLLLGTALATLQLPAGTAVSCSVQLQHAEAQLVL